MDETVTYLEMTAPDELRAARAVPGVELEPLARTSPLIRETTLRIAKPYSWPSLYWSDKRWSDFLRQPSMRFSLIRHDDEIAGLADFQAHPDAEVEITTFGLVPEFVGKRIGAYALTLVLREAWQFPHDDGEVRRVWLHTSSLDHPHALPNYLNRGQRAFRTEQGKR